MKSLMIEGYLPHLNADDYRSILKDNSCWSGFVFLVGFLTVFRTSQAYIRFGDGCTAINLMRAEWYDACSSLVAFSKSTADKDGSLTFQHILIRLFSMLHAVALADIEDTSSRNIDETYTLRAAFQYDLVDPGGLDMDSLRAVKDCHAKVELIYNWIQQLVVENIDTGVLKVPAPILSRSFQELSSGMVSFREAVKVSSIPFPFPYAQICEVLLMLHWLCTPLVVSQYVSAPWWGALFSFLQVFVYWSMNGIAIEIEHPFGTDANDLDTATMQEEMNGLLRLLLEPWTKRTPVLSVQPVERTPSCAGRHASLLDMWSVLEEDDRMPVRRHSFQQCTSIQDKILKPSHRVAFAITSRTTSPRLSRGRGSSDTPSQSLALRLPTPAATPILTPNESVQSLMSVPEDPSDQDECFAKYGSSENESLRALSPVRRRPQMEAETISPRAALRRKANLEVIVSQAPSEAQEPDFQAQIPEQDEIEEEADPASYHAEPEPSLRCVHGPKVPQPADVLEDMVLLSNSPSKGMGVYPRGPPRSATCSPGSQLPWGSHGLHQLDAARGMGHDLPREMHHQVPSHPASRGSLNRRDSTSRSHKRRFVAPPPPSSRSCFSMRQLRPVPDSPLDHTRGQPAELAESGAPEAEDQPWHAAHGFSHFVQIDTVPQPTKQQI